MPETTLAVAGQAGAGLTRAGARALRLAMKVVLVGMICHLSTEFGFAHKFPPHYISPLWPTNAILFGVLVVAPVRHWWAYTIAAFFTSIVNDARAGFPLSGILFLVGDLIEVAIAVVGVRRFAEGRHAFDSLRSLLVYLIVAVVLAPFASAFVGALAGAAEDYWFYWRAWFFSEALAYLTLAPAILTGIARTRTTPRNGLARGLEAGLLGCGLLAISVRVFSWPMTWESSIPALVYLPLPLLLWAAVRFGPVGVTASLLVVAVLSISGAVHGRGPFTASTPADNVLALQLFLITMSVPLMFLATAIQERREQTKTLSESEARFRAMADTAPVLIWMSGTNKLCTFFNKGWLDFTGRRLEQELGDGWLQGVHPLDLDHCLEWYGNAFDARRNFSMEYRLRRHDGQYRLVSDQGVPRFATDGEFLGYIGCAIDITERKQAEERPRQVLDATPNAMIMVTPEGRITLLNAAVETVFGYSREELIGQPIEVLIPDRFAAHHPAHRKAYGAAPQTRPMGAGRELFGRRKDGREVPVEIGLTPIETPEGRFVLASIIDITARKHAEFEAQRHREEVAHVTRISTMGELAASLAHELNQPLTAILSNVQAAQRFLAADPPDLGEVREILKDVVYDDNRAGEVIHRLRAFVKKQPPDFGPIAVDDLMRDVMLLVHSDAVLRNSYVSLDVSPGLPPVRGDRIQLQQVTLNLLLNAFEAMNECPANERYILVRASSEGPRTVRIAVRDHGLGVPKDTIDRIFQPFYTTKPNGMGMGLSIGRSIIEAHGGRLWVENNSDRGATFSFTLPVNGI